MSDRGFLDELPPFERQMWESLAAEFGPKYAAQLLASSPGELVADMLSYELGYAVNPEDITPELAVTKLAMDQLYAQAKTAGLMSRAGALGTKALSSKAVGTAKSVGKAVWNNPAGKALTVGTAAAVPLTAGAMVAGNHVSNKIQNAGMVAGGANFLGATLGGALGSRF